MPGQPVVLETLGGLVATARPEDIPEGASPRTWDTDFIVGRFIQRAGLQNVYSYAATTFGPNAGGNAVNVSTQGSPWINPNNILSSDAVFTDAVVITPSLTTDMLLITNFNFAVPSTVSVVGIGLQVSGQAPNATLFAQLFKAGVAVGNIYSVPLPTTFDFVPLGGNSDLWGTDWDFTDVDATNFGVNLWAVAEDTSTIALDYAQLTIFCNESATNYLGMFSTELVDNPIGAPAVPPNPPPIPPTPPSITNATASIVFPVSRPLGNPINGALWSNFDLLTDIPADAVIVGIFPVIVASANADPTPAVEQYMKYGATVLGNVIPGQSFTGFPSPSHSTFASTEFTAPSIGTSLSALTGQNISAQLNESRLLNNLEATMDITAVAFAIQYTSALPVIDPQIPPPFVIPPGNGLAWALPSSVATTQAPNQGLLDIVSDSAVIGSHTVGSWVTTATFNYTLVFGPTPAAGQPITIENTIMPSGTGSSGTFNGVNLTVDSATGTTPTGSFNVLYNSFPASSLLPEGPFAVALTSTSGGTNTGATQATRSIRTG